MTETSGTSPARGPYGQQPTLRRRPSRPPKSVLRWLWLPGAVAFLSIAVPVAVVAAKFDQLDVAAGDGWSGTPNGLSVELVEGHKYWLYTDVPAVADSCTVEFSTERHSVTLSRSGSSLAPEPAEPGYELLGSLIAPDDGVAALSCPVDASELVIFPDDSIFVWVGLTAIGGVIGFLGAVVAAIVIVVVWSNRRKRAAQPIGGWYGQPPTGWSPPLPDRPAPAQPEAGPQPEASGPSTADPWAPPDAGDDERGSAPRR